MEKRLWFKAKTYGWGWRPVTWEGWLAFCIYIGAVLLVLYISPKENNFSGIIISIFTGLFFALCFYTGEKPHRQWGEKK